MLEVRSDGEGELQGEPPTAAGHSQPAVARVGAIPFQLLSSQRPARVLKPRLHASQRECSDLHVESPTLQVEVHLHFIQFE